MNKQNIMLLAKHIYNNVTQEQFNMQHFRVNSSGNTCDFISITDCGTVGCALGHAPFITGLETSLEEYYSNGTLAFLKYCERVFDIEIYSTEWDWLFDDKWTYIDNTPKGFAKRVFFSLESGIPEGFIISEIDYYETQEYVKYFEENKGHESMTR